MKAMQFIKIEISVKNSDFWDEIYYANNEKKVQVNTTLL
jgi:hypothetical protein